MLAVAAAADAPATALSKKPRRVRILPVLLVLALGLEFPLDPFLGKIVFPILSHAGWSWPTKVAAETIIGQTIFIIAILLIVHFWERLPIRSIGIAKPAVFDLVLGIAVFLLLLLVQRVLSPFLLHILASGKASSGDGAAAIAPSQVALIAQWSWPTILAVAASGSIFEEIWARGYGIERVEALTHSTLASAAIMLVLDLAAHVPFWGIRYAVLIAPYQILFLGLYLWQRRLMPCVVAHMLWDSIHAMALAMVWLVSIIHPMHAAQGWQALNKGNYDNSIAEFSIVLRHDPNDVRALEGRSNAYWYKGKYDLSIGDLNRVITLEPGNEHAYWNRANTYFSKHDYSRATADANQAIKLAPNDPDTYSMRADIDAAMGDDKGAIKDLGRAIKLTPSDYALIERREGLYEAAGDYDGAIADLSRLLALDPGNSYLLAERSTLYRISGQPALAARDESVFIATHKKDSSGYLIAANMSYGQHQYGAAIDDLNRAIALSPNFTMLYQWRAVAYARSGKSQLAIADWRRVLSKQPKATYEYSNHAWILATCPLAEVRNGKQAVEFATQSCKLSGWKDAENLDTLAAAYAELGDFADAVMSEKKALATLALSEKRLAPEMRDRLVLYQRGHPYHATYPTLLWH